MKSVEVKNLNVNYGLIKAVKGISFSFKTGEITSLIGSNGAGKTTTLKALCALLPHSGEILIHSESGQENIASLNAPDRLKKKIALCPEGRGIFPNLTVSENLMLGAYLEKSKQKIEKLIGKKMEKCATNKFALILLL